MAASHTDRLVEEAIDLLGDITTLQERILDAYLIDTGDLKFTTARDPALTRSVLLQSPDVATAAATAGLPLMAVVRVATFLVDKGYDWAESFVVARRQADVFDWISELEEAADALVDLIDQDERASEGMASPPLQSEAQQALDHGFRSRADIQSRAQTYIGHYGQGGPYLEGKQTVPIAGLDSGEALMTAIFDDTPIEEQLANFETGPKEAASGYVNSWRLTRRVIHADRWCDALSNEDISAISSAAYRRMKNEGWDDCVVCSDKRKAF